MFQDKQVVSLFPSLLWVHALGPEVYEPLNARLLEEIEAIIAPRPALGPGQSWQTETTLHKREAVAGLLPYIREAATSALQFMEVEYEDFEITGCWGNVKPHGVPHPVHAHPNNYLSGVYYVKSPSGGDTISFHDPRPQSQLIAPVNRRPNNHNTSQINYPVAEGRMLVFPAWFRHSVLPNESDQERVSISFNIVFSSFTEKVSPPKWQGLASGRSDEPAGA